MEWIGVRHQLTVDDVKSMEESLGIDLPEDYVNSIGEVNGGALRHSFIMHPKEGRIVYSRNVPINEDSKGNVHVLFNSLEKENKRLFPFGSVGNGDYFCFDLEDECKVVLWKHEEDKKIEICDSYSELFDMMRRT